jgi:hypothetical protein
MEEKFISANGKEIYLNDERRRHLNAHPGVINFLEEAISKINIPEYAMYFQEAINLGRIIGISRLVKADKIYPDDEADFALRVNREWPVRVSLVSKGESCDSVTLEIKFDEQSKKYFLNTAYIGFPCPDSPYHISDKTSEKYKEALEFWCRHALAYDQKIMGKPFKASWSSILVRSKT